MNISVKLMSTCNAISTLWPVPRSLSHDFYGFKSGVAALNLMRGTDYISDFSVCFFPVQVESRRLIPHSKEP
jgi:hypothetical protein